MHDLNSTNVKGFAVYCNDIYVGFVAKRTKKAVKDWIRFGVISTHMGEFRKSLDGYEYHTTIGRNYAFKLAEKVVD